MRIRRERWLPVPKHPQYQASNLGKLKRLAGKNAAGAMLKEYIFKGNHRKVGRLVLLTFKGPPPTRHGNKIGESCARHLDDNFKNNAIWNLEWGTPKQNSEDAKRNGRIGTGSITAAKIANTLKGQKLSDETKRKISEAKRGNKFRLGIPHTEEAKRLMSITRKGRGLGKKHSLQSRKNMSDGRRRYLQLKEEEIARCP